MDVAPQAQSWARDKVDVAKESLNAFLEGFREGKEAEVSDWLRGVDLSNNGTVDDAATEAASTSAAMTSAEPSRSSGGSGAAASTRPHVSRQASGAAASATAGAVAGAGGAQATEPPREALCDRP